MKTVDILLALVGKDLREHHILSGKSYTILKNNGCNVSILKGKLKPILYYKIPYWDSVLDEPGVIVMVDNKKSYLWEIEA